MKKKKTKKNGTRTRERKTACTSYILGNDSCGKRYAALLLPLPPPPPFPFLPILFIRVRVFPRTEAKNTHSPEAGWRERIAGERRREERNEGSAMVIGSRC